VSTYLEKLREKNAQTRTVKTVKTLEPTDTGILTVLAVPKQALFSRDIDAEPVIDVEAIIENARASGQLPAKRQNLTVEVYTPAGDMLTVEAKDEAHAQWLRRVDPKPSQAAIVAAKADPKPQPSAKLQGSVRIIAEVWRWAGKEKEDGSPYVNRLKLIEYLMEFEGESQQKATDSTKNSPGRFIGCLIAGGIIKPHGEAGWLVDQAKAKAVTMSTGGEFE
jgi:hypothetical protein